VSKLALTLACGDYEIMRALHDGRVAPDGIDLLVLSGDRTRILRSARRDECDLSEFNIVGYLMDRESNDDLVALPVFPHRRFRHGFIFYNAESGIEVPSDLAGRRVGIRGRAPAAAIWLRGILGDEHGVPLDEVRWVDLFGVTGTAPESATGNETISENNSIMDDMLVSGDLDAIITPSFPPAFLRGGGTIRRLFPDYRTEEVEYFRRTGIFPIMHAVVLRRSLLDAHPWVASSMAFAFQESKKLAYERVRNPRVLPLAFFQSAWEDQCALLGPDPWRYGFGGTNRHNLETIIRYAHEQGLISRRPELEEAFVPLEDDAFYGTPGF